MDVGFWVIVLVNVNYKVNLEFLFFKNFFLNWIWFIIVCCYKCDGYEVNENMFLFV